MSYLQERMLRADPLGALIRAYACINCNAYMGWREALMARVDAEFCALALRSLRVSSGSLTLNTVDNDYRHHLVRES